MQTYKIMFVKNMIDSCKLLDDPITEDIRQEHNGFLIHALVRAKNETEALEKAENLIAQISTK